MSILRANAIEQLGQLPLDPVEKICIAQAFDIEKDWALSAFVTLCTREETLSSREATELGIELVLKVSSTREDVMRIKVRHGLSVGHPPTDGWSDGWGWGGEETVAIAPHVDSQITNLVKKRFVPKNKTKKPEENDEFPNDSLSRNV